MMKTSDETMNETATPGRAKARLRRMRANAGSLSRKALSVVMSAILVVGLSPLTKVATADENQASAQSAQGQLPSGTYWYNQDMNFTTIDASNGFTSGAWDTYRDTGKDGSGNALGIAGSFHLVAFDTLSSSSHIYGNILANHVTNIQDYGVKPEFANIYGHGTLSYIQDYQASNNRFGEQSYSNQAIVFGNNTDTFKLTSYQNNGHETIKFVNRNNAPWGSEVTFPRTIAQDLDTANAPFIDMSQVKAETTALSGTLSAHEDTGATYDFADQNKKTITYTKDKGCAYLTLPLSALTQNGNPLYIKGLPLDGSAALVINVDCGGADAPIPDQVWLEAGNGQNAGLGENDADTGYVLWNFTNAKTVTAMGMVSSILAPGATINLKGNSCGTFIGNNINVSGETHTRPFHGKFTDEEQPKPETTSVSVNKQWLDSKGNAETADVVNAHEGVKVQLYRSVGEAAAEAVADSEAMLSASNNWSYTWDNLPAKDGSDAITYTVKEVSAPNGYASSVTGSGTAFTITNKHKPEVSVSAEKVWDDNGNVDQLRPASLDVDVLRSVEGGAAEKIATLTLNADNSWKASLTGLPKESADGKQYTYSVQEGAVTGYTGKTEGSSTTDEHGNVAYAFTLTNTHAPSKVSVSVSKTWVDGDNQDGIRPKTLKVQLLRSEGASETKSFVQEIELTAENGWQATVKDLPVWGPNGKYTYSVSEAAVEGYTSAAKATTDASGNYTFALTNTHTVETTSVGVTKVWNDGNNADGLRPDSVEVELLANGDPTGKKATLSADNKWAYAWDGLAKKANGNDIEYSVREAKVDGYTSNVAVSKSADGKFAITLTNTHEQAKTSVSVNKEWSDSDNQDGVRPDSVEVQLYRSVDGSNPVAMNGYKVTLNKDNSWQASWTDLPANNAGKAITYTVKETNLSADYTYSISKNTGTEGKFAYTLTNTHEVGKISVKVTKAWSDNENQDGKRPASVQVQLYADGVAAGEPVTVFADKGWTCTWENLAKKANGNDIAYTVKEVTKVDGYTSSEATGDATNGFTITNTHVTETTQVNVAKVWDDVENVDGIRPGSVEVELLANGKPVGQTLALSDANEWKGAFTGLAKYEAGKEIAYAVQEKTKVEGYTVEVAGGEATDGKSFSYTLTNKHEQDKTSVSVTKAWVDNNDHDGLRPGSVEVELLADGVATGKKLTLNADNNWKGSFSDLAKKADGNDIAYTVRENAKAADYEVAIDGNAKDGFVVTNTHETAETSVSVAKAWDDADNQDGKRPESVQVQLYANGEKSGDTVTLNEGNEWKHAWSNLAKLKGGEEIKYTVEEAGKVEGYTSAVTGDAATGFTITNTHAPETTSIDVSKTWEDSNDQDGLRPDSVTVQLKANGEVVREAQLTADGNWSYKWENLPVYKNGEKVNYTVAELDVAGYTSQVAGDAAKGFAITNTHGVGKTSVSVEKKWNDADDQDGLRPEFVKVQLLADGVAVGEPVELNAENNWAYQWQDLDVKAKGQDITYTVSELDVPAGYEASVTGDAKGGFTITNTHNTAETSVSVTKAWNDNENQDGLRPESVQVQLYANGKAAGEPVTLSVENGWKHTWDKLDKLANGNEIKYTVQEVGEVDGYASVVSGDAVDGFTITNTHAAKTTGISVKKVWDDSDNQDGIRPASVTAELLADGTVVKTAELSAGNNWAANWSDLPVYANGKEIAYTVQEAEAPEGYTVSVAGNIANGFTITNTHATVETAVSVHKVWKDAEGNDQSGVHPAVTAQLYRAVAGGEPEAMAGYTVMLDEVHDWAASWANLPVKSNGEDVTYTVQETDVPAGYTSAIEADGQGGYAFTMTNIAEKRVSVSVTKAWNDGDNADSVRPDFVTAQLCTVDAQNNPVAVSGKTVELSSANNWTYTWDDLAAVDAEGNDIVYLVQEANVPAGYDCAVSGGQVEGGNFAFTMTNTHELDAVDINVSKVWNDENDVDGLRPASVTAELCYVNEAGETVPVDGVEQKVLDESSGWAAAWTGLVKNSAGKAIKYTVRETAVPEGYTASVSGIDNGNGTYSFTMTNEHQVEVAEFALSGFSVRSITAPVPEAGKVCYVDPKVNKVLVGRALQDGEFKFQLINKQTGEVVSTASNDALGMVDFDAAANKVTNPDMEPSCLEFHAAGTYTYEVREVSETKDPTINYSNEKVEFVTTIADVDGQLQEVESHYVHYKDANDTVGTVVPATEHPTIMNNVKPIELGLTKTDEATGEVLPGATYGLYRADSASPEGVVLVAKAASDANGHMLFTTTGSTEVISTGVDYWFEELSAPEGYARSLDQTQHFHIDRVGTGADSKYQLVYADGSKGQLYSVGTALEFGDGKAGVTDKALTATVTKVDSSRTGLSGAKLGIRLADGTDPVDEWTSNGAGHVLSGLKANTPYVLYEAEAPEGFEKAADVTFTLDEFGTITLVDGAWGENVLNSYATDGSLSLVDYTHREIVEGKVKQREETKTAPSSGKLTQTGDQSPVLPLAVAAVVALVVLVVAGVAMAKRRKR